MATASIVGVGIAIIASLVVGCMPAHHGEHGGEAHAPRMRVPDPQLEEAARAVRVMSHNDLRCRPEVLGLVDVHEDMSSSEQALSELKLRAAELGAEAVIGVDFEHGDGHDATHLSGMAVRCRDLLKGRSYDVIATIEVPGAMGDEASAFARLKERGRELRADLLVDVVFDHGEHGRGPTRLKARAIRFREASAEQPVTAVP